MKKFQLHLREHSREIMRFLLAFLVTIFGSVIALNILVQPAVAGPGRPFGGQIYNVVFCDCTNNFAIYFRDLTIAPPITLPLIYEPAGAKITFPLTYKPGTIIMNTGPSITGPVTILYPYYQILKIGSWILGTWQPYGVCMKRVGKFCVVIPTAGTMYMVGTSM